MTQRWVVATGNRGKLAEFAQLFAPFHIELLAQSQFTKQGAEETGATFRENALLKARHAATASGLPAIADDSGLEVDALDGAPGVYSARYAGVDATDADNNAKLLAALVGKSREQRTARFRCVLAFVRNANDPEPIFAEGVWSGCLLNEARGQGGFGYDPLFLPDGLERSSAELTAEEKNQRSHRGQALQALMRTLVAAQVIQPSSR
jgi:XTP/dITP diphosphohydrolase